MTSFFTCNILDCLHTTTARINSISLNMLSSHELCIPTIAFAHPHHGAIPFFLCWVQYCKHSYTSACQIHCSVAATALFAAVLGMRTYNNLISAFTSAAPMCPIVSDLCIFEHRQLPKYLSRQVFDVMDICTAGLVIIADKSLLSYILLISTIATAMPIARFILARIERSQGTKFLAGYIQSFSWHYFLKLFTPECYNSCQ